MYELIIDGCCNFRLCLTAKAHRAVARALIGGCILIYSGSARLVSFEIKLISKEVSRAESEYMNIHLLQMAF